MQSAVRQAPALANARIDVAVAEAQIQQTWARNDWKLQAKLEADRNQGVEQGTTVVATETIFKGSADLTASGYVVKAKDGRRNRYQIQSHLPLREAITQQRTIGEVLDVLVESKHCSSSA